MYPRVPSKTAKITDRLYFIDEQIMVVNELLKVLGNSITSIEDQGYHCNCWQVWLIREKLELVTKQITELRRGTR